MRTAQAGGRFHVGLFRKVLRPFIGGARIDQQQIGADLQTRRYPFNIVDGDITLSALDAAEIGSIHFDVISKVLLAEAKGFPVSADIRSNDST
jgi:hypothetical protein